MPQISTVSFHGPLPSRVGSHLSTTATPTARRGLWAALLLLLFPLASNAADYLYIGGAPKTSITAGRGYYFRPWVSTPATARKKLTYSIVDKPYWASFNTNTGVLSGTVRTPQIGSYRNVQIGVSDGHLRAWTRAFSITVQQAGGSTPPVTTPPVTTPPVTTPPVTTPPVTTPPVTTPPVTTPPVTTPPVTTPPVTTPPTIKIPVTPSGLSAKSGNAQASLTWSASSGATSYHVKRATVSGGAYAQVASVSSTSYSDTAINNGRTYYYVVSALDAAGESANSAQVSALASAPSTTPTGPSTPIANNCGMQLGSAAIFCDTFDAPAGIGNGNRSGDLNGNVWGVSRTTGNVNFGQSQLNMWNATVIQRCDGTMPTVVAPNDILICNGQLREASNDNNALTFEAGTVTVLAMYPKQPFDFAGRTGTVSFDVSNDTAGTHAAWPEFWLSDLPVPAPFSHFDTWESLPANGLAVRLGGNCDAGSQCICPNSTNINSNRWTVDSAAVIRNYVMEDSQGYGPKTGTTVTILDCVTSSNGPGGGMNHIELRISQNQIDVYSTDAGVAASPATLKHIAVISKANLTLTRGLIWIEDAHYNADKGDSQHESQRQHTFAWDNVAFDGPFSYRDFSYDAPDNTAAGTHGAVSLGKASAPNQTSSWNVPGLPANPNPTAVRVLFNFSTEANPNPSLLNAIINGHAHSVQWPYPDQAKSGWRTFAITVPVTDLVAGTNVVQLGSNQPTLISNVNIVLVNVPGGVPVLRGANDAYPAQ